MLTRRHILVAAAAALAAPLAPRRIWAGTSLAFGGMRIDTLSDGHLVLPVDFTFGDLAGDEVAALLARHGMPADQMTPPCNVTLLRDGTNTVLFDVGSGPDFMPTAGKLAEALAALDLAPEDVTHVVFTHAHPDHIWGLLDEFDEPLFPAAEHAIGAVEHAYWTDPATVDTIGEARATFAIGAARRLEAVADSIRLLEDGEEVLPGLTARLTPGHTPGHMAFELRSDAGAAMVVGDAIGNHHIAFERPDWASPSDQDPPLAAATRVALMERLAAEGMPMIGYHLPGGGIGRVVKAGDAWRFEEME
ncbi:MBL fold metallo-hydrolase [Ruixingdingia sedimenti]|uniref:MBL fold metallo-hydrolase n=1 Tax=Ruixingdingia sedimenti TaxID=3073604 RepID=A0ABU1F2J1_9RHOB|nr:MBL fold metallo-hydrolase [Xinfangfangia sp. LG-4]MDR5651075.1 MBL fold metallo-hydrolase [Xinfangfangia sp. LG-4]